MISQKRQQGVTLIELLVVVTIITLLTAVGLPAFKALSKAFESGNSVERMINSMLAAARATAIQDQRYVGVRFQKAFSADPLRASQYMILIERDALSTGIESGFKAIQGLKPVKLPDSVGVMDLNVATENRNRTWPEQSQYESIDLDPDDPDGLLDEISELWDVTTFSMVFSPQGHLVVHGVRVRNNTGKMDSDTSLSQDDVFNTLGQVQAGVAQFCQDDYFDEDGSDVVSGVGPEASRLSLVIYETAPLMEAFNRGVAWSGYLRLSQRRYGNRYTGALITSKP
ncbi:MAG: prepilin-type N-terminal cleavage/methylation domain-containing protein [Phycisphaeraceae bacterium]|nr:prepilin-type N-terminal cleavage/methylation domain-containing protein [Phycisphaeraceae bacterium]